MSGAGRYGPPLTRRRSAISSIDGKLTMSAINEAGAVPVTVSVAATRKEKPPLWKRRAFYRYGFLVLILALWEILGPLVNPILFSYPSRIALAAVELTASGELLHYLLQSLQVLFLGLGFAILIGIPLAVLMARLRPVDWALDLPVNALYATPMVALVPILVLWFGIYLKAKVIVVFLFSVFPILINTYQGVRECDKSMLEVARSFRSTELRMWRDVLLPFAVPYMAAGVRLAIGRGLVGMVIAEFYTTISGLGFMITRYANIFEMDKTFVPVILLMFLGVTMTALLKKLERKIAPWSRADT
jgi:NitT/TauT family transport system permease protein